MVDLPSGHDASANAIHRMAVKAAGHFDLYEEIDGETLLDELVSIYVLRLSYPAHRGWSSLPALDRLVDDMASKFAVSGMRDQEQKRRFAEAVSLRFRDAFVRAIPALSRVAYDTDIGLAALHQCIAAILRDRDRAVAASERAAAGIVGRIMARFALRESIDVGAEFMACLPDETLGHAVAIAARRMGECSVDGMDRRKSTAEELDYLIDVAARLPGIGSTRINTTLEEARALANQLHVLEGGALRPLVDGWRI